MAVINSARLPPTGKWVDEKVKRIKLKIENNTINLPPACRFAHRASAGAQIIK
jgi:hypothetical protein